MRLKMVLQRNGRKTRKKEKGRQTYRQSDMNKSTQHWSALVRGRTFVPSSSHLKILLILDAGLVCINSPTFLNQSLVVSSLSRKTYSMKSISFIWWLLYLLILCFFLALSHNWVYPSYLIRSLDSQRIMFR